MLNKKALAGTPSTPPVYVEDVFSTYLWDGNSTARNIVNGIDLAGKGGLVWTKYRNATNSHRLYDTNRGATKQIFSNLTNAEQVAAQSLTAFNSDGFSLGTGQPNETTATVVGWTFRKQPKFFDIVTYTGNGSAPRDIAHNLGSSPGFIIIKRTNSTGDWWCWHRSIANKNIYLNYTDAADSGTNPMISAVSSTNFTLATNQNATMNINGATYVAYLFAHDAGGFGTAGTDNIISCGSFTTNGNGQATVTLGYEPQYFLVKQSSGSGGDWQMFDVMRGFSLTGQRLLNANLSDAEAAIGGVGYPTATGAYFPGLNGNVDYIYMAIRRPMKTPTSGTEVFMPIAGTNTNPSFVTGFPVDMGIQKVPSGAPTYNASRLVGARYLTMSSTAAEATDTSLTWDYQNGYAQGTTYNGYMGWNFRRAPGFFDIVCYTGTGSATTQAHNLGAVPELIIVKSRSAGSSNWTVWNQTLNSSTGYLYLNDTMAAANFAGVWNGAPTSTYFTLGTNYQNNDSGVTFVAYLFATVAGVSKVGSYTGTGSAQTINCGFTAGARFVMIKRTDSTGDWYIWDTARGIVSGNDPFLLANTSTAQTTNTDYIDPANSGFEISSTAPAAINANGGSFIFLAIA